MATDYRPYEGKFVLVKPMAQRNDSPPVRAIVDNGIPYTYAVRNIETGAPYIHLSQLHSTSTNITPLAENELSPLERSLLQSISVGSEEITLELNVKKDVKTEEF
ncbi:MAG: hypothetical protein WC595_02675 [Candidatus Nanoarchaeia archaeon]